MHCPRCSDEMHEVPKSGVLIDVCPRCRGVFLDRGELEKIMSRAREYQNDYDHYYEKHHQDHYKQHDHHYDHKYHKHHKKKGLVRLLEEIFD